MKRRTYNNMVKACKMIAKKGYDWQTANEIAMRCFDDAEANKASGQPVEWYIDKVASKEEWESESK